MNKDARTFIGHILESIKLIEEYTNNKTEKEFLKSIQLQDSVIRRIEIIGEAIKSIPEEVRGKYLEVPWKKFSGVRDILIAQIFWDRSGINMGNCYKRHS